MTNSVSKKEGLYALLSAFFTINIPYFILFGIAKGLSVTMIAIPTLISVISAIYLVWFRKRFVLPYLAKIRIFENKCSALLLVLWLVAIVLIWWIASMYNFLDGASVEHISRHFEPIIVNLARLFLLTFGIQFFYYIILSFLPNDTASWDDVKFVSEAYCSELTALILIPIILFIIKWLFG